MSRTLFCPVVTNSLEFVGFSLSAAELSTGGINSGSSQGVTWGLTRPLLETRIPDPPSPRTSEDAMPAPPAARAVLSTLLLDRDIPIFFPHCLSLQSGGMES